ncbi:MAG TPA: DUF4832 domain-containing protein [Ktedonosporobacter sp.]|nr:DUF4832 domain-containing protein [Ktedonosporobacter sp.]
MKQRFIFNRIQLLSLVGLLIMVLGGVAIYAFTRSQPGNQADANGPVRAKNGKESQVASVVGSQTFTPIVIPATAQEIGNPLRGPQYYGDENPPPNWPLTDRYDRWCWSEIEPNQGQYNFQPIDDAIAKAKAAHYTFGWRIMPMNPDGNCMPNYLSLVGYNSPQYLARAQALMSALGKRYDSNPNVGLLDMSLYGCFGEWNESCGPSDPMTAANRQRLIDMQFQAFPHKRFVMLTDHQDSFDYAMNYNRPLRTGIRIDCLGEQGDNDWLGGARSSLDGDPIALNQWKVAPMVFEYCNGPDFSRALADIKKYHAAIIGDGQGNINDFGSYSANDQKLMMQNYRISGYRFELNSLTLPQKVSPGATFTVNSKWTNTNITPAYSPWNVMLQFRSTEGTVVWGGKSALDLQKPFSASSQGNDAHATTDTFTLPNNLASGTYKVCVQIVDANKLYAPLALANTGRAEDGSYCFGLINV